MLAYECIYIVNKDHERESQKEVDIIPRTANLLFVRENISERNRKRGDKKEEARLREMPKEKMYLNKKLVGCVL